MRKLIFFFLIPFINYGQVQIGQDIDGTGSFDFFGENISISLDGNTVAIGADEDSQNDNETGYVQVYGNQNGAWVQIGEDIVGQLLNERFGVSLSLSEDGSIVAIGADMDTAEFGEVRIFENQSGSWVQLGQDISGEASGDQSGASVSLSSDGNIVAIGASFNDGNGNNSGHVRIYENQGGTWVQLGQDIDGETANDLSGISVSLSSDGTIVAIGAPGNDGNGSNSGHVRIFENQSDSWVQLGQDIEGEVASDQSGGSVSLSSDGNIVAIGASFNDGNGSNSGHVRVFENQGGSWIQLGQDIDGEDANDSSGESISLSSDGSIIAIGAGENDSNGDSAGHVRIFQNQNGVWVQLGQDINGEAAFDFSGEGVSLSANASTVAVGARFNDENEENSGHVRIFSLSELLSAEEFNINTFALFPNPTSSTLTLDYTGGEQLTNLVIIDLNGKLIQQIHIASVGQNNAIDVSNLNPGIYFIQAQTENTIITQKLIKN